VIEGIPPRGLEGVSAWEGDAGNGGQGHGRLEKPGIFVEGVTAVGDGRPPRGRRAFLIGIGRRRAALIFPRAGAAGSKSCCGRGIEEGGDPGTKLLTGTRTGASVTRRSRFPVFDSV